MSDSGEMDSDYRKKLLIFIHPEHPKASWNQNAVDGVRELIDQQLERAAKKGEYYLLHASAMPDRLKVFVHNFKTEKWLLKIFKSKEWAEEIKIILSDDIQMVKMQLVMDDNPWTVQEFLDKVKNFNPLLDVTHWSILEPKRTNNGRVLVTFMVDVASYETVTNPPLSSHILLGTHGHVKVWKYGDKRKEEGASKSQRLGSKRIKKAV